MPEHTCYAAGCRRERRPFDLMCAECWRLVPPALQKRVYAADRRRAKPGGLREYSMVIRAARDAVVTARARTA